MARVMLVVLFAVASSLTAAVTAQAADAPASLTMHSDQGDFFGQGKDYSYTRPQDQVFANAGFNHSTIFATVNGLNGDRWSLEFDAPDRQPLAVGEYTNAQGAPFEQAGNPGIQVDAGFTCQTITGQFDVLDIEFTNGTLSRLDVTFEEHCNGAAAALTGELIYTPISLSPLPPLVLGATVSRTAALSNTDGGITARGTVTCTQFDWTTVEITFQQDSGSSFAFGTVSVPCSPGTPAPWTIFANENEPFRLGASQASAFAFAEDANNGTEATSPTVNLTAALTPSHG
jgi:hypothetical protein